MTALIQTKKIGVAGSFINQLYGNNESEPVVGEYCTFLSYTDRSVGIVREWHPETLTVVVENCFTCAAELNQPHGHQNWQHNPSGHFITLQYRKDAWYYVSTEVVFTTTFQKSIGVEYLGMWLKKNRPALFEQIYGDHFMPINVVEGVTRAKKSYTKKSVIFNVCDYYYDWSF